MSTLSVFVPVPLAYADGLIAPGSGIVGYPADDRGRVKVYYEGNLYGAASLARWWARLTLAAGRLEEHYPTVATAVVPERFLVRVGAFALPTRTVELDDGAAPHVCRWLGVGPTDLAAELAPTITGG